MVLTIAAVLGPKSDICCLPPLLTILESPLAITSAHTDGLYGGLIQTLISKPLHHNHL
jgi:hypothetical protein